MLVILGLPSRSTAFIATSWFTSICSTATTAICPPASSMKLPRVTRAASDVQRGHGRRADHPRWRCQIDYPLDWLEIQVLDDSTGPVHADIARLACEDRAAKGYPHCEYIHRDNREGYKAGGFAEGLSRHRRNTSPSSTRDFVPPADILQNVVQYFTDDQGRHGPSPLGII